MAEIPYSIRDKHVHIVGVTGSGKSSLIAWWVYHDILYKHGAVCVIDPKGDLVDNIMRYIPDERLDDVILTDIRDPLPLDFMSCPEGEEDSVVADLKFILMGGAVDPTTMPTINDNIEAVLYTLIDANKHPHLRKQENRELRCTLLDAGEFFTNEDRRNFIRAHVTDPKYIRLWNELPNATDRGRILSRINPFIRSATLSKIMGDPSPRLDINKVINEKKILLARLPVVNRASAKYGSLLMAKIQHASFSRHDIPAPDRIPLYLYVDEFQHFQGSEDFHNVLDMGRGYQLCFTLSITRLQPLTENMKSALGTVQTFVVFQIFHGDANYYRPIVEKNDPNAHLRTKLEGLYLDWQIAPAGDISDRLYGKYSALQNIVAGRPAPLVTIQDAIDMPEFHAIYKVGRAQPVIEETPTPGPKRPTEDQARKIQYIKNYSAEHYGRQATNAESSQISAGDRPPSQPAAEMPKLGDERPDDDPSIELEQPDPRPPKHSKV